jgi:hypothetical protein
VNHNIGPDGHLTRTCPALIVNIGAAPFWIDMEHWKTFETPPKTGTHILVVFYWPNGDSYNMCLYYWEGFWNAALMEQDDWGMGTYPVKWMYRPEYPDMPEDNG